jgi:hypothetical protein
MSKKLQPRDLAEVALNEIDAFERPWKAESRSPQADRRLLKADR